MGVILTSTVLSREVGNMKIEKLGAARDAWHTAAYISICIPIHLEGTHM